MGSEQKNFNILGTAPSGRGETGFLDLPREIRDEIYYLALESDFNIVGGIRHHGRNYFPKSKARKRQHNFSSLPILRTNRQIRAEALDTIYSRSQFFFGNMAEHDPLRQLKHLSVDGIDLERIRRIGWSIPDRQSKGSGWFLMHIQVAQGYYVFKEVVEKLPSLRSISFQLPQETNPWCDNFTSGSCVFSASYEILVFPRFAIWMLMQEKIDEVQLVIPFVRKADEKEAGPDLYVRKELRIPRVELRDHDKDRGFWRVKSLGRFDWYPEWNKVIPRCHFWERNFVKDEDKKAKTMLVLKRE